MLTFASGARRSDSAYERFLAWSRPAQLFTGGSGSDEDLARDLAALEGAPFVEESAHFGVASLSVRTQAGDVLPAYQVGVAADIHNVGGRDTFERAKLLRGHRPDPASTTDAVIGFATAEFLGVDVGDTIDLAHEGDTDEPPIVVKVAAVVASPNEFPTVSGAANKSVVLTQGFARAHPNLFAPGNDGVGVRIKSGYSEAEVQRWLDANITATDILRSDATKASITRTIQIETVALWVVAAVLALVFVVLVGQLLLRIAAAAADDVARLTALGMTRRDVLRLGAVRGALVGGAGAVGAVLVGTAASRTMPVGLARIAEPDPGVRVDLPVQLVGVLLILAVAISFGALAAQRTRLWVAAPDHRRKALRLPDVAPAVHAGLSMLVRPGRRRESGALRTSLASLCLVVSAVAAVAVNLASLSHVQDTPPLVGATWDGVIQLPIERPTAVVLEQAVRTASTVPNVAAASATGWMPMMVDGHEVQGQVFKDPAVIGPAIASGRAPVRPGEIAMGADTMRRLGLNVGERVELQPETEGSRAVEVEIVGRSVLVPPIFFQAAPGDGLAVPAATTRLAGLDDAEAAALVIVRFRDGENVHRSLVQTADALGGYTNLFSFSSRDRTVVDGIDRIRTAPRALLAILGVLGTSALIHMLFVSTRRRRVDLVVLRTLGFTRRQVITTTSTEAIGIAIFALVVGVPLGLFAGRIAWQEFADYLRVVPAPVVPVAGVTIVVALVLGAASLTGLVAGIRAGRVSAAEVLRIES